MCACVYMRVHMHVHTCGEAHLAMCISSLADIEGLQLV